MPKAKKGTHSRKGKRLKFNGELRQYWERAHLKVYALGLPHEGKYGHSEGALRTTGAAEKILAQENISPDNPFTISRWAAQCQRGLS